MKFLQNRCRFDQNPVVQRATAALKVCLQLLCLCLIDFLLFRYDLITWLLDELDDSPDSTQSCMTLRSSVCCCVVLHRTAVIVPSRCVQVPSVAFIHPYGGLSPASISQTVFRFLTSELLRLRSSSDFPFLLKLDFIVLKEILSSTCSRLCEKHFKNDSKGIFKFVKRPALNTELKHWQTFPNKAPIPVWEIAPMLPEMLQVLESSHVGNHAMY